MPEASRSRRIMRRQRRDGRMTAATVGKVITVALAAAIVLSAMPARAQPVAEFYRGKTLRMLVGYGPGGGYDIYGRLVAEFLARHLPGNPTIMPEKMRGAGSFVAAKSMYGVEPRDGTVTGRLAQRRAGRGVCNGMP